MKCLVEGHEVPASFLARQPMNFNQPWPQPARALRYQIIVHGHDFLDMMQVEFERAKEEEIADAPFYQPGEVPELDRWKELGFPPAEELFAQHPKVLEGVVHWMGMETLDRILPDSNDCFQYVLNSLDRVTVVNGTVYLEGRAYEKVSDQRLQTQSLLPNSMIMDNSNKVK